MCSGCSRKRWRPTSIAMSCRQPPRSRALDGPARTLRPVDNGHAIVELHLGSVRASGPRDLRLLPNGPSPARRESGLGPRACRRRTTSPRSRSGRGVSSLGQTASGRARYDGRTQPTVTWPRILPAVELADLSRGISAPRIMELARLQAWTLKPAIRSTLMSVRAHCRTV